LCISAPQDANLSGDGYVYDIQNTAWCKLLINDGQPPEPPAGYHFDLDKSYVVCSTKEYTSPAVYWHEDGTWAGPNQELFYGYGAPGWHCIHAPKGKPAVAGECCPADPELIKAIKDLCKCMEKAQDCGVDNSDAWIYKNCDGTFGEDMKKYLGSLKPVLMDTASLDDMAKQVAGSLPDIGPTDFLGPDPWW
jgi:hypothetical protein